jgi:hypothetical protein
MTLEQIKEATVRIGKIIAIDIPKESPADVMDHIGTLAALLATSSYVVAASEKYYKLKVADLLMEPKFAAYPSMEKKMICEGKASEELELMRLTERQNKAITHKIDGLRSIISYIKEDNRISQYSQA